MISRDCTSDFCMCSVLIPIFTEPMRSLFCMTGLVNSRMFVRVCRCRLLAGQRVAVLVRK